MKRKILVVDDDPDIRVAIRVSLELDLTCSVFEASDGESACLMAKKENPDAILLDTTMPGMDGFSTLKNLQNDADTKKIPVIFLSAHTTKNDQEKGLKMGAIGYFTKPFDPLKLAQDINKLLGQNKPVAQIPSILWDLIQDYLASRKQDCQTLKNALNQNDYQSILRISHKIKGNAGTYGLMELSELAKNLELATEKENHHKISEIIQKIENYLVNVQLLQENKD